ncbi:MAG TPA: PDZ domain-containing protein [Candidatus Saccharicenans sp.]|nr:PDZ domain-containing protein [Candidatus Saccharicenans sp.]
MKNSKLAGNLLILTVTLLGLTSISQAGGDPAASNVREIVRKASPSVVRVEVRDGLRRVATGVVIDKDGYIATTALISPRDEEVKVIDYEGNQAEADFLGFDPESRIAFLQVKNKKLPAISKGSSAELAPGSWVCALGISPESQIQVTQGIVSSVTVDRLRLNITITPGMSGGPVLNEKGQLVGLLRGVYAGDRLYFPGPRQTPPGGYPFEQMETPPMGMAMAIPVEMLNDVFKEIRTKGKVERGWLGVSIGEDADHRVIITEVEDESPASLAKLQPGDRILKINGKEIRNADQFISEIRSHHPGQQITLTIDRQGKVLDVEARLGNLPEEEAFRELELRFPDIFLRFPRDMSLMVRPEGPDFEFGVQNYGFLGVFLEQLTPELSKYFGVPEGQGLLVARLVAGGPAEKAGLKVGDVIVGADGKRVETLPALSRILQKKKKGEKLVLEIIRDRKKMELEVAISGSILEEGRD